MKTRFAVLTALSALSSTALAQRDFSAVEIKTIPVTPGIYMLEGAGGNIGLSVGPDGPFVIDDQFAPLSEKIMAAIAEISDKPVKFVLNTHWHGDHTGGNEAFAGRGAIIVAHDNARKRLKEGLKRETSETPPAPAAALPVITFSDEASFYWNGHDIRIRRPRTPTATRSSILIQRTSFTRATCISPAVILSSTSHRAATSTASSPRRKRSSAP